MRSIASEVRQVTRFVRLTKPIDVGQNSIVHGFQFSQQHKIYFIDNISILLAVKRGTNVYPGTWTTVNPSKWRRLYLASLIVGHACSVTMAMRRLGASLRCIALLYGTRRSLIYPRTPPGHGYGRQYATFRPHCLMTEVCSTAKATPASTRSGRHSSHDCTLSIGQVTNHPV